MSVAPDKLSPAALATGRLSPVIADSSTVAVPSITTPSTGIRSPVFKTTVSPATISAAFTVASVPFLKTTAVSGTSFKSAETAAVVLPLALASKYFPTVMSVRIIAAESK